MKRIILWAAVAACLAAGAAAQPAPGPDDLQSGEWFITSMTNDVISIPDTDGFPYNLSEVAITSIDGQPVTDIYQLRFPLLAAIRYDYDGDRMRLRELRVLVEYSLGAHSLPYPEKWVPEMSEHVQPLLELHNAIE